MKQLGYVIYHFWDFKTKWTEAEEWETNTCQPHLNFRKKVYEDYASAEDAVEQMKKIDYSNTSYHILPIYTPEESYDKVRVAYKERTNKQ